jgi:hypothetical protein
MRKRLWMPKGLRLPLRASPHSFWRMRPHAADEKIDLATWDQSRAYGDYNAMKD